MIKLKKMITERYLTFEDIGVPLAMMPEIYDNSNKIELSEDSKNDPIPELSREKRLAIFLFGPPASGKTTFVKNSILPKTGAIKIINPDDMNELRKQIDKHRWELINRLIDPNDPNAYVKGTKRLAIAQFKNIIQSGVDNVIFDTTGNDFDSIEELVALANENNFKYIFIHMLAPKKQGEKYNKSRERSVDSEYLDDSYDIAQSLIKKYTKLNPLSYYIIVNIDNKYTYYKYDHNQLLKKKGPDYT